MEANEKKGTWYRPVLDVFFDYDTKIPANDFMILFASAMTVPSNRNYNGTDRAHKRKPEEIHLDQIALLNMFEDTVDAYQSPTMLQNSDYKTKDRVLDLANALKSVVKQKGDTCYMNKDSNYKPHHFFNFYLYADIQEQKRLFSRVSIFYKKQLELIYHGREDERDAQFQKTKALIQEQIPGYQFSDDSVCEQMGQCLNALLLWYAVQDAKNDRAEALLYRLLDIDPPEPCATRLTLSLKDVMMPMEHFITICSASMRAELELNELTIIFQMLTWVREKMGHQLDPSLHTLVQAFVAAANSFADRKAQAYCRNRRNNRAASKEAEQADDMCDTCLHWIEQCWEDPETTEYLR